MIDKEVLSNIIDKAIANGYKPDALHNHIKRNYRDSMEVQLLDMISVIFSHDFAKAFWGEELNTQKEGSQGYLCCDDPYCCVWIELPLWKFHLQQMVLEENPIEYLEKFL